MEKQMNSNYLTLFKAPKIDLHLHLQGAANMHVFSHLVNINKHTVINQILNDDFLYERYSKNNEIQEFLESGKLALNFSFLTINDFFAMYRFMCLFIRCKKDLYLYIKGVIINLINQNIIYSDIIISLPELLEQNIKIDEIINVLNEFKDIKDIKINWWIDLVRHNGNKKCLTMLEKIIKHDSDHIIYGINLGGKESSYALNEFSELFKLANDNDLKINIHDGEIRSVDNNYYYKKYGISRIAHGLNYIQKGNVHNLSIEVCLTSNVNTKIINSVYEHPLFESRKNTNNICICTDDPTLFQTNLALELLYVLEFYNKDVLIKIITNSLEASGLNYKKRYKIIKWYIDNIK